MVADAALHVVLGATGRIGSTVATSLLREGRSVRIVTRSEEKARTHRSRGAEAVVGDLDDPDVLRAAFRAEEPIRVFALNPPGPITGDPDVAEIRTAGAISRALRDAAVAGVVALSTYGARTGDRMGTSARSTVSRSCCRTSMHLSRSSEPATSTATGTARSDPPERERSPSCSTPTASSRWSLRPTWAAKPPG